MPNPYPILTRGEARRALAWFQKAMRMRDWRIDLYIQDESPKWVCPSEGDLARCSLIRDHKWAKVWISNARCFDADNWESQDPMLTLFHELAHVMVSEGCYQKDDSPAGETVVWSIARALRAAYKADRAIVKRSRRK